MAGHSKSDLNLDGGTSGTVTSNYLGTYLTWIDARSGYYLDGVLKLNRFRNEAKVGLSDGHRAKGDYDNTGLGGSLEFGRNIKLAEAISLSPIQSGQAWSFRAGVSLWTTICKLMEIAHGHWWVRLA